MLWSLTLLALGLAAALLAATGKVGGASPGSDPRRSAPPWGAWVAYGLPALFFLGSLWLFQGVDDAHRLRLALLGVGFRGTPGEALTAAVGGDSTRDDVWLSRFSAATPLGQVVLVPPGEADPEGRRLRLERPPVSPAGLLVPEDQDPLGTVALRGGEVLRVAGEAWTVDPARRAFTGEAGSFAIPRRTSEIPIVKWQVPVARPYSIRQRTYPLRAFAPSTRGGEAITSFLFEKPGRLFGRSVAVAVLDPDVTVEREGAEETIEEARYLDAGVRLRAMGLPRVVEPFRSGGIRDLRSFRVLPGDRSLAFVYDTPEVHTLSFESLQRLRLEGTGEDEDRLRVSLTLGDWQFIDRSLHLRHASRAVAGEGLAMLDLPAAWREPSVFPSQRLKLTTPRGGGEVRLGEAVWLGERHLAAIQVDLLSPPLLLGFLALLLAVCKATAARAAGATAGQLTFALVVEGLVALRVLLGYRVWVLPPYRQEAMELALVAWVLLPWVLLVAMLPPPDTARRGGYGRRRGFPLGDWLPALGGLAFAAIGVLVLGGGGARSLVWVAAAGGSLLIPLGRWGAGWWLDRPGHSGRQRGGIIVGGRGDGGDRTTASTASTPSAPSTTGGWRRFPQRCAAWVRGARERPWFWAAVAGLFLGVRGVLLLFGFKERLPLGTTPVQLTLLHIPLALAVQAWFLLWLWRRAEHRGEEPGPRDYLPALYLALGIWVLPSLLISDLGLALLGLPVFLMALAAASRFLRARFGSRGRARWRRPLTLPVAVLILAFLFLGTPMVLRTVLGWVPQGLHQKLASERNYLRLLAYAYPEELADLALRESEELAVMSVVMRSYIGGGGWLGRGYGEADLSVHLRATSLREHAPTVFVAGEWGLVGILGVAFLYLAVLFAAGPLTPWHWRRPPDPATGGWVEWGALTGGLAALTFAFTGLYMILANYQVVLFTGKNPYLLGLDSAGDVMESLVLLLLGAAGSALARDGEVG
jgi:hypothetical protein